MAPTEQWVLLVKWHGFSCCFRAWVVKQGGVWSSESLCVARKWRSGTSGSFQGWRDWECSPANCFSPVVGWFPVDSKRALFLTGYEIL
jgi:hypothetical protein